MHISCWYVKLLLKSGISDLKIPVYKYNMGKNIKNPVNKTIQHNDKLHSEKQKNDSIPRGNCMEGEEP